VSAAPPYRAIRLEFKEAEQTARITLNAPKANIVDRAMLGELSRAFAACAGRELCAVVLAAEGPHFSFGASVQEHLPESIAETLAGLHGLIRQMIRMPAPLIAAVRGQCLGGGFELALACDVILAEKSAVFACPEIKLGVFAPAASALLPARIGAAQATARLLTGAPFTADAALALGLVAEVAAPGGLEDLIWTYLAANFVPRSTTALRFAVQAARAMVVRAVEEDLPHCEQRYLEGLMSSADAVEGIRAFLEKREPRWQRHAAAGARS